MFGFRVKEKWQEHQPEAMVENDIHKILWDFSVQADPIIETQRPDLIVRDEENSKCQIIDFAIPDDTRLDSKEIKKD